MSRVFFHYNKPATQRSGTLKWSVHWRNRCMVVDAIKCCVPVESKANKRQPRAVMRGWAKTVTVRNGLATIV